MLLWLLLCSLLQRGFLRHLTPFLKKTDSQVFLMSASKDGKMVQDVERHNQRDGVVHKDRYVVGNETRQNVEVHNARRNIVFHNGDFHGVENDAFQEVELNNARHDIVVHKGRFHSVENDGQQEVKVHDAQLSVLVYEGSPSAKDTGTQHLMQHAGENAVVGMDLSELLPSQAILSVYQSVPAARNQTSQVTAARSVQHVASVTTTTIAAPSEHAREPHSPVTMVALSEPAVQHNASVTMMTSTAAVQDNTSVTTMTAAAPPKHAMEPPSPVTKMAPFEPAAQHNTSVMTTLLASVLTMDHPSEPPEELLASVTTQPPYELEEEQQFMSITTASIPEPEEK
ncbi:hypothetical protein Z043_104928, partial [Scleropages formosus]